MKKLFARLFKKEPEFDYVIAEYQPTQTDKKYLDDDVTETDVNKPPETDEMEIDNIYKGL